MVPNNVSAKSAILFGIMVDSEALESESLHGRTLSAFGLSLTAELEPIVEFAFNGVPRFLFAGSRGPQANSEISRRKVSWRRERDSNSRNIAVQRFSRPPP
jgi:hypothetical protein